MALRRKQLHELKLTCAFELLKSPDCSVKVSSTLKEKDNEGKQSKITLSNSEKSLSFNLALISKRIEVDLINTEIKSDSSLIELIHWTEPHMQHKINSTFSDERFLGII